MTKSVFLLIFLISVVEISSAGITSHGNKRNIVKGGEACLEGWRLHQGTCYHISSEEGTFGQGLRYCRTRGGEYAVIKEAVTWEFLKRYLNGNYWLGLNDAQVDGTFKWIKDGTTATFSNWNTYEPRNSANVDGIVAMATTGYKWKTSASSDKYRFICEMDSIKVTSGGTPNCPSGFEGFQNSCYHISTASGSWAAGRSYCKNLGADYTKINNKEENEFLGSKIKGNTWIGLNDLAKENEFRWDSDNSAVTFSGWAGGEPNDYKKSEDCVHLYPDTYHWNDNKCDTKLRFICEMDSHCPSKFYGFRNSCYHISSAYLSWEAGRSYCKNLGADYTKINNNEENEFLVSKIKGNTWIGLNDLAKENEFRWVSDNSAVTFSRWARGEPNDYKKSEDCVHLYTHGHKWNDHKCYMKFRVICEMEVTSRVTLKCPSGFEEFQNSCYHISTAKGSWGAGRSYCINLGADYSKITNNEVNAFLGSKIKERTWIGLSDLAKENEFRWVSDNSAVTFSGWAKGEPNDYQSEDCVHLYPNTYHWNDHKCYMKYRYTCEASMVVKGSLQLKCPSGWTLAGGKCYFITKINKNWQESRKECQQRGGDLASVHCEEDNKALAGTNQVLWVGLDDQQREGTYCWASDGSRPIYTKWHSGEPNNHGNEDCVEIWKHQTWNDVPCERKKKAACEKKPAKVFA